MNTRILIDRPRNPIHNLLPSNNKHNLNPRRSTQYISTQRPRNHSPKAQRIAIPRPHLKILRQLLDQVPWNRHWARPTPFSVPDPECKLQGTNTELKVRAFCDFGGDVFAGLFGRGGEEVDDAGSGSLFGKVFGGVVEGGYSGESHAPGAEFAVVGGGGFSARSGSTGDWRQLTGVISMNRSISKWLQRSRDVRIPRFVADWG